MVDNLTRTQRTETMRRIRSRDTAPELLVRSCLRELGYTGYRLHRRDVAGNPDIVWLGKKLALFVHGCFWHGHNCHRGARVPKTRRAYWVAKIARNKVRDQFSRATLKRLGWRVLVLWECRLTDTPGVMERLGLWLDQK